MSSINKQTPKDGAKEGAVSTAPNYNTLKTKHMYRQNVPSKTTLEVNKSYEGARIEDRVRKILNNNEPITDGAPRIYTERKDGVRPEFNIKTDRFEIAVEAMDVVTKSRIAKREERAKTMGEQAKEGQRKEGDGKPTGETKNDG